MKSCRILLPMLVVCAAFADASLASPFVDPRSERNAAIEAATAARAP